MLYIVRSQTESFQTDSLDEAHSVMEIMVSYFGCASIIDNITEKF